MGVPSFYRWLINKYPNIRVQAIQDKGDDPVDTTSPNPNAMEFDNLYLDMNGIIHPCFHPEDQALAPTAHEDVFKSIYAYIDRLFSIVRPKKLLYMAIDGVAPRAKMNQQRSRRFRTAKDAEIAEAEEDRLRMEFEMEGKPVLPRVECEVSDSNVITPGTEFMDKLSKKLITYIDTRLCSDPAWKEIQVVLSDANVPGEGEHKIVSFIRHQRSLPGYQVDTRHCIYGLDADLIMLALATHEVHFSILREDVLMQEQQPAFQYSAPNTSNQVAEPLYSVKSRGWFKDVKTEGWALNEDANAVNRYAPKAKTPYEVAKAPENFQFDLERIIDDFIFMCFFAGNDFLPHMPTLSIHEGGIDLLMTVYKKNFKNLGGYLVNMEKIQDSKGAYIKLKRVEKFILLVSRYEEDIFKKRSELLEHRLKKLCRYSDAQEEDIIETNESSTSSSPRERVVSLSAENTSKGMFKNSPADKSALLRNTKELKAQLKENLRKKSDLFKNGDLGTDKVKLGTPGWKQRYYKLKFSAETSEKIETTRKEIVEKYTEGLLWVLLYYFSGVPSWTWYYPYHYGPFASDLKGLSHVRVKFQKGHPFKPFYELMSVLPRRSADALPKPYAKLITDEGSKISEFYPEDFEIDTDGKRYAWQGICKLPFIDEERLMAETRRVEEELTKEEAERNEEKCDQLFVTRSSDIGTKILTLYPEVSGNEKLMMTPNLSGGIGGLMWLNDYDHLTSTSTILSLLFNLPDGKLHIPRPLEGVEFLAKKITAEDIRETFLWHEYHGSRPPYNNRSQSRTTFSKANDSSKPLPSRSTTEIHKGAGTGWGAGRGRAASNNSIAKGVANLKMSESESNQNMGSYRRGQTATNTFWPSRNQATAQSSNYTWRHSSHANTYTSPASHSFGRGQGQGRGRFNPSNSAWDWHSRDPSRRS
ncbi:putative 5-3 exonuclease protein [Corchorus capsularis]|uniref:5'-3' exoribonuclease n=1 Tax=Corchorus capsularis TaxID=210143 RepID=A0A1R3J2K5_COCAP|nr:putative 5-3 exonuclease protein [Corchorus capsularis]